MRNLFVMDLTDPIRDIYDIGIKLIGRNLILAIIKFIRGLIRLFVHLVGRFHPHPPYWIFFLLDYHGFSEGLLPG